MDPTVAKDLALAREYLQKRLAWLQQQRRVSELRGMLDVATASLADAAHEMQLARNTYAEATNLSEEETLARYRAYSAQFDNGQDGH